MSGYELAETLPSWDAVLLWEDDLLTSQALFEHQSEAFILAVIEQTSPTALFVLCLGLRVCSCLKTRTWLNLVPAEGF